jgi:hypothetical protein
LPRARISEFESYHPSHAVGLAFDAMRKRGMSQEEVADRIERVFEQCFRETIFFGVDRRMIYRARSLSRLSRWTG